MKTLKYREITGQSGAFYLLFGLLGALLLMGLWAVSHMEHEGHHITGMTNQIVWGLPHVFAVFLIVAASGALNVASISSVFNKAPYKPLARVSGLLAITLLLGGLMVLVLDLGRPDRMIVAMTYYNIKSIFSWNMMLYNGFIGIVIVYLWFMMEPKMNKYYRYVGFVAFFWRLILTTGTGSIFGFLVARQAYDAAIMAPMFIAFSFSYGLAIFVIVMLVVNQASKIPLGDKLLNRLKNLQAIFIAASLYFVLAYNLTNIYATEHHSVEHYILLGGNVYTVLFWFGQVFIGAVLPLILFYAPVTANSKKALFIAMSFVVLGGLAQMYVTIIGGQAYPLVLFPGMEESSSFFDGRLGHPYTPSYYELLLGMAGIALSGLAFMFVAKVLKFFPVSLANEIVEPEK